MADAVRLLPQHRVDTGQQQCGGLCGRAPGGRRKAGGGGGGGGGGAEEPTRGAVGLRQSRVGRASQRGMPACVVLLLEVGGVEPVGWPAAAAPVVVVVVAARLARAS